MTGVWGSDVRSSAQKFVRFSASLGLRIVGHVRTVIGRSASRTAVTEKVGGVELWRLWLEGEMERPIETEGAGPWGDIFPRVA
jgi:hypothetical protein